MSKKDCYQEGASRLDVRYLDNSRSRESKSQSVQLEDHNLDNKDIKTPMKSKTNSDLKKAHRNDATANDLQHKIQSLLQNDTNLANYDIRAYCNQRQAEITGIVDVLSEKEYAQNLVQSNYNIPVINSISISTDGHIVDKDVYQEIVEELNQRDLNAQNLSIEVSDGTVTLQGQRPHNIKDIMNTIKTARGVSGVQNLTSKDHKEPTLEDYFHSQVNNDIED